jgi:hypothetical protein
VHGERLRAIVTLPGENVTIWYGISNHHSLQNSDSCNWGFAAFRPLTYRRLFSVRVLIHWGNSIQVSQESQELFKTTLFSLHIPSGKESIAHGREGCKLFFSCVPMQGSLLRLEE